MNPSLRASIIALSLGSVANAGAAQSLPGFGGVEVRTGITLPEAATAALGVMAEADIGYVWRPQLRTVAGVSHFRANIDREPGDNEGSFVATGFWLGTRYDLAPLRPWGPYVRAALTLHRVDADAWDPAVDALLTGTTAGIAIAAGARYGIDDRGRLAGTFEVRRTFMNNLAQTSIEVGLRLQRRGFFTYLADPVAAIPLRPTAPPRTAAPVPQRPDTPPGVAPPPAADQPPAAAPALPGARDTAEAMAAAAARREAAERAAAEQAAEAERLREEAAAVRASIAEARLRQGLERATAVMSSVSSVRETADAWVVTLGGGAFPSGASSLSQTARAELRALATVLSGYPGHIIQIEGHTDAQGAAAANQVLSEERAAAVRAALIVEGVDALWTAARGFGQGRPVADNATEAGRALNRRVEIHVSRRPCDGLPAPGPGGTLICNVTR